MSDSQFERVMRDLSFLQSASPKDFQEKSDAIYEAARFLRNLINKRRSHLQSIKKPREEKKQKSLMEELLFIKDVDPWRYKQFRDTIYGAREWVKYELEEKKPQLHVVGVTEKKGGVIQTAKRRGGSRNDNISLNDDSHISDPDLGTRIKVLYANFEAQRAIIKGMEENVRMVLNHHERFLVCAENLVARIEKLERLQKTSNTLKIKKAQKSKKMLEKSRS